MNSIFATLGLDWAWTTRQWIGFAGALLSGLGSIGLLGYAVHVVRSWTAPATYRAVPARRPRPSLQLAEQRRIIDITPDDFEDFAARFRAATRGATPAHLAETLHSWPAGHPELALPVVDPTGEVLEAYAHTETPGPGSLASLRATGRGHLTTAEPAVDPDTAAAFAAVFDRVPRPLGPGEQGPVEPPTLGVLSSFHRRTADAMAKAARWLEEDGLTAARHTLDAWRIDTPTGEWPVITPRATAYALLAS